MEGEGQKKWKNKQWNTIPLHLWDIRNFLLSFYSYKNGEIFKQSTIFLKICINFWINFISTNCIRKNPVIFVLSPLWKNIFFIVSNNDANSSHCAAIEICSICCGCAISHLLEKLSNISTYYSNAVQWFVIDNR